MTIEHTIEVGEIIGVRMWCVMPQRHDITSPISYMINPNELIGTEMKMTILPPCLASGPINGFQCWPTKELLEAKCLKEVSIDILGVNKNEPECKECGPAPCTRERTFVKGGWNANNCGIYAWNFNGLTERCGLNEFSDLSSEAIAGLVALSGRVIEHEHGYRAEFARPIAFLYNAKMMGMTWDRLRSDYEVHIFQDIIQMEQSLMRYEE